jgi:hypothetical protein
MNPRAGTAVVGQKKMFNPDWILTPDHPADSLIIVLVDHRY